MTAFSPLFVVFVEYRILDRWISGPAQHRATSTMHIHTIYRDPTNDYGKKAVGH
jgi:hypothetical protein